MEPVKIKRSSTPAYREYHRKYRAKHRKKIREYNKWYQRFYRNIPDARKKKREE